MNELFSYNKVLHKKIVKAFMGPKHYEYVKYSIFRDLYVFIGYPLYFDIESKTKNGIQIEENIQLNGCLPD